MRGESISEIHISSRHQENQSVHEVDEFREEDWKQLDRESFCPKREFRNSGEFWKSILVSKSGKKTKDCISRVRQNTASHQGKRLELH